MMQIVNLYFERKGGKIVETTGVIIKQNTFYRYLFIPALVENLSHPNDNIRASIIVQKKNKNDEWSNYNTLKISALRAGEYFNVDIPSEQLDIILDYCDKLKEINDKVGLENLKNTRKIMIVDNVETIEDVKKILELINNNPNGKEMISKLIELTPESISNFFNEPNNVENTVDILQNETKNLLYSELKARIINTKYLEANLTNSSESFWQNFFTDNPNILSSIIPCAFQLICSKPYLGGKGIENRGGVISDYLYKFGSINSCIIEIKTPSTSLMNKEMYRDNVYTPSSELTGAIVQSRNQKDMLYKSYYHLKYESNNFDVFDPKIFIIIGNGTILTPEQFKSFELFRRELKDIEIITFDELIEKLKLIENVLILNN